VDSEMNGVVPVDVLDAVLNAAETIANRDEVLLLIKWDALRSARFDCPALCWTVVVRDPRTNRATRNDVKTLEEVLSLLSERLGVQSARGGHSKSESVDLTSWYYLCLTFGYTTSDDPGWHLSGKGPAGPLSRRLLGERSKWISTIG
jgi:hypothetical protein